MSLIEPQLTSSVRQDWETPQDLFDKLNEVYHFDWDAAATGETSKTNPVRCFDPDHEHNWCRDALSFKDWQDAAEACVSCAGESAKAGGFQGRGGHARVFWLNPPYGRDIRKWMDKAYEQSRRPGVTVVALTFARTDTRWWHEVVSKAAEVRLLKGRVKFLQDGKVLAPAPAPSAVITFAGWSEGPPVVKFGL